MKNWKSYEALEECIRRDAVEVANLLHQSKTLIQKWKEAPATDEDYTQSGTRNPLDRIEKIITAIEKIDPKRAYIPILWLCARFGFLPPVKMPAGLESQQDILKALLKWNEEFGETCAEISKTLRDGKITEREYKVCYREAMEDIQALMELLEKMKERVNK